jgi:N4-gp56 family major capsid protein
MPLATVAAANKVKRWDSDFFAEYVRSNRFSRYMGTDENAIIQIKENLTKSKGDTISIPLVAKLSGAGVTGNSLLEGNEEALNNYEFPIVVDTLRNAVAITDNEEQMTEIDMRAAAKLQLKNWAMEKMRTDIITGLGQIFVSGGTWVSYGAATAGNKNAWNAANTDRILFGAAKSNYSATHATALANVDTTNDRLTTGIISLMKRIAKTSTPIVRPYMVEDEEEWYVMFANSLAFRDLKTNMGTVHQNAMERGKANPIFRDGDLVYDGVVIREIPEIGVLTGVGATASDVSPVYLCGAQALGVAWAKRTKSTTDTRDYGFVHGVGVAEMRGVRKAVFNGKDHGIVTGFVSTPADA